MHDWQTKLDWHVLLHEIVWNRDCWIAFTVLMLVWVFLQALKPPRMRGSVQLVHGKSGVLLRWKDEVLYRITDFLAGGLAVLGRTGSGKTSALKYLVLALLQRHLRTSMLIMCPKPSDSQEWLALAKRTKRSKDVIHLHPKNHWRINLFDAEAKRSGAGAGQAQNITRSIMQLRQAVFREPKAAGGENQDWTQQFERGIFNAVSLLLLAKEKITPAAIQQIFLTTAQSVAELNTTAWREGLCNQLFAKAFHQAKTSVEKHDFEVAAAYFLQEMPTLADRTRSSIQTGIFAIINLLNTGLTRELFFTESNFSIEQALEQGKIILIDYPPDEYGNLGFIANLGIKHLYQKAILRRAVNANTPLAVIWGDEAMLWTTEQDVEFLSRSRQARGAMVYLNQSLPAFKMSLGGQESESLVLSLLANFSHKLVFACGDWETAEFASQLAGEELEQFLGGSVQHQHNTDVWSRDDSQAGSSFNESYQPIARPDLFLNGLRTGGPENNYLVDGLLIRSGQPFPNGYNILSVSFDQRV